MMDFHVELVGHDFVKAKWPEIVVSIRKAFQDSDMMEGFTEERPIRHTWENTNNPPKQGLKHVVAVDDADDSVLGAIFLVPSRRIENETESDLGWIYTIVELSPISRIRVIDALFGRTHDVLGKAGFRQVITEIGTKAGMKYMTKRLGYRHVPKPGKENRWMKDL